MHGVCAAETEEAMNTHSNSREDAALIESKASEWLMRQQSGLDGAAEAELAAWLGASLRHAEAFERSAAMWAAFDRADARGLTTAITTRLAVRARQRRTRRRLISSVTAAAVVLVAGTFSFRHFQNRGTEGRGEIALSLRELPDGSFVELKSGARVDVRFEPNQRRVILSQGEAHFSVAKDATRPFVVQAGGVEVKAVGTAFSVDLQSNVVDVVVTEGQITLDARTRDPATIPASAGSALALSPAPILDAGQRVRVNLKAPQQAPEISVMSAAELSARLAWRKRRLDFANTTLAEAVASMNRHNRVQIVIGDSDVGQLLVSGTFGADNPEGFVRIIEGTFNLRAEPRGQDEIVLRALR
jgi:transmembrane sensor